jgi:hypothetical protein
VLNGEDADGASDQVDHHHGHSNCSLSIGIDLYPSVWAVDLGGH